MNVGWRPPILARLPVWSRGVCYDGGEYGLPQVCPHCDRVRSTVLADWWAKTKRWHERALYWSGTSRSRIALDRPRPI